MKKASFYPFIRCFVLVTMVLIMGGCFDPSFPNTCFLAGTRIATPEGAVAIEDLQLGQSVLAYDENSGEVVDAVIEKVLQREVESYVKIDFPDGRTLLVTHDHPIAIRESDGQILWIDAGRLTTGHLVVSLDEGGKSVRNTAITLVEPVNETVPVYNFKVRHYQNSFAEGVLSHFYFENTHQLETQR